jgi:predicted metal-binding membrane protein
VLVVAKRFLRARRAGAVATRLMGAAHLLVWALLVWALLGCSPMPCSPCSKPSSPQVPSRLSLVWLGAIGGLIALEKLNPRGAVVSRVVGVLLSAPASCSPRQAS